MKALYLLTVAALVASLVANRRKTLDGVRKALSMFLNILPSLLLVLALISVFLYILPPQRLQSVLDGNSRSVGMAIAAALGSIALIPGFVAYPLCGLLIENGVSLDVVAVFITTLMMVGVLTLPLESHYFGTRTAVVRNLLSLAGALVVGVLMGVVL